MLFFRDCLTLFAVSAATLISFSTTAEIGSFQIGEASSPIRPQPHSNVASSCDPATFRIALDVGHTMQAPGATSARGVPEHDFNLRLAKDIEERLKASGFRETYLVTTTGQRQLQKRVFRANALKPKLFLSIHHDDVQPLYYDTWNYKGKTYHFSDKFSGYSIFVSFENRFKLDGLTFASLLGSGLVARGMHFSAHHAENLPGERKQLLDLNLGIYRYDKLFVLRNTAAPAVLLEAGIIVNRDEELQLASSERQNEIAEAVTEAATKFCSRV
jgi:N-acetylmuramoyl-L-alanine amidase